MSENYAFTKMVQGNIDDIEKKLSEELKRNGFEILTRIDIQKEFTEKLNMEYKKYIILGACNIPNTYRALDIEDNIGLLLPYNIILYEKGSGINIGVIKPTVAMSIVANNEITPLLLHLEKELIYAVNRL